MPAWVAAAITHLPACCVSSCLRVCRVSRCVPATPAHLPPAVGSSAAVSTTCRSVDWNCHFSHPDGSAFATAVLLSHAATYLPPVDTTWVLDYTYLPCTCVLPDAPAVLPCRYLIPSAFSACRTPACSACRGLRFRCTGCIRSSGFLQQPTGGPMIFTCVPHRYLTAVSAATYRFFSFLPADSPLGTRRLPFTTMGLPFCHVFATICLP